MVGNDEGRQVRNEPRGLGISDKIGPTKEKSVSDGRPWPLIAVEKPFHFSISPICHGSFFSYSVFTYII